jgi:hypothetical protein
VINNIIQIRFGLDIPIRVQWKEKRLLQQNVATLQDDMELNNT